MSEANPIVEGDDFVQGVLITRIAPNGMLLGHARGEPVILARHGDELFSVGATCTHYGVIVLSVQIGALQSKKSNSERHLREALTIGTRFEKHEHCKSLIRKEFLPVTVSICTESTITPSCAVHF